jgi:hypothetical protein
MKYKHTVTFLACVHNLTFVTGWGITQVVILPPPKSIQCAEPNVGLNGKYVIMYPQSLVKFPSITFHENLLSSSRVLTCRQMG